MSMGATLIDTLWQSLPDARATVSYGGETIERALCVGVDETWQETEQGIAIANAAAVRYKANDEPASWNTRAIVGKVLDLILADGAAYRARVTGRAAVGGAVRLTIQAEFDQR